MNNNQSTQVTKGFSQIRESICLASFFIVLIFLISKINPALSVTDSNLKRNVTTADKVNMNNTKSFDDLAEKLTSGYYGDLYNYYNNEAVLDRIWSEPNSKQRLENIVKDENAPMKARFLACEVLFKRNLGFTRYIGRKVVAEIYVEALINNYSGMANSWGFLYELDDAGPVGSRLITMGEEILPILIPLLDNNQRMGLYRGSKEATLGNNYQYRIKDFAAYYISEIKRIPVKFYQDFDQRDAEIERLKAALANEAR